ncbi:hypothetical protein EI94DRAFT_1704686 [Lactarius quietus]|nr:hypothetical protein EI94DRAFT_1704686 [Lactarius quietus]
MTVATWHERGSLSQHLALLRNVGRLGGWTGYGSYSGDVVFDKFPPQNVSRPNIPTDGVDAPSTHPNTYLPSGPLRSTKWKKRNTFVMGQAGGTTVVMWRSRWRNECQVSKNLLGAEYCKSVQVPCERRAAGRFSVWLTGLLLANAGRKPDASGAALDTRREVSGFPDARDTENRQKARMGVWPV